VNLVDGLNVKTGVETLGSDLMSLNAIVTMINNAAIGVTASLVNDADGRPNLLQLTSGAAIALGSAGDTSNFLAATHILESPAGATRS
jgi:flagellar capping protein FliD